MKNKSGIIWSFMFLVVLTGCGANQQLAGNEPVVKPEAQQVQVSASQGEEPDEMAGAVVAPEDEEGYMIKPVDIEIKEGRPYLPVGAEISTHGGKVDLGDVIRAMANHKDFSVSWADDVDQLKPVDCYIKAADNFYDALDNILRQLDYFYEIKEGTIVVSYKETKRYHLAIPNFSDTFNTSLGGDMLGGETAESSGMKASATLQGEVEINFWDDLESILGEIIQCDDCPAPSLDRNMGIITVRAPKRVQDEVKEYLDLLGQEAYKQVVVEAKIIEVTLSEESETGIDWENILGGEGLDVTAGVTPNGLWSKDTGWNRFLNTITLNDTTWDFVVHAFEKFGDVRIVSNPKVHILNGRSALLNVTQNMEYVSAVEVVVSAETGVTTTSVTTSEISEGLSMAVKVNIVNDQEVMLYIFPTVARLIGDFEDYEFGVDSSVQLATTAVRQMSTYAKVKDKEFLVIGGLIDKNDDNQVKQVPILGDLPFIGKFFRYEAIDNESTELVILLRPKILTGDVSVSSVR